MTPLVERAAVSALYWAQPCRRSPDSPEAVRGCVAHLSDADRMEAAELIKTGTFTGWTDEQLLDRMLALAAKAARR